MCVNYVQFDPGTETHNESAFITHLYHYGAIHLPLIPRQGRGWAVEKHLTIEKPVEFEPVTFGPLSNLLSIARDEIHNLGNFSRVSHTAAGSWFQGFIYCMSVE